jgi:ubiquinone/menaquinone biosynthesis C-methylase UbiE
MVNKEIKLVTNLHLKTKRKYLERMMDNKIKCMIEAKKYKKNYWDGDRKFGYGGYKYIPGRWEGVAKKLIKKFKLNSSSKILDVGCGKAFLLYEIKKIIPNIKIFGFDVSKYAIKLAPKILKKNIFIHRAEEKYPYKKNYFDLVISLGCLHNLSIFNLKKALKEISRVGKNKYIMVESYKNNKQLFNLQCWALTCDSFFSQKEWKWIFKEFSYNGFYEFIYFD